jgi:glycosyltransferase involved in cell wall biosynthesis
VIPAADFLISGSESESAGMTILEAAALQVPSVVVKNGGSNELIIDGENGFLLEQIGDLFGKIQQIASSQEKLEKMGQSASIWARANAHPNSSSKKFLSLYESIA